MSPLLPSSSCPQSSCPSVFFLRSKVRDDQPSCRAAAGTDRSRPGRLELLATRGARTCSGGDGAGRLGALPVVSAEGVVEQSGRPGVYGDGPRDAVAGRAVQSGDAGVSAARAGGQGRAGGGVFHGRGRVFDRSAGGGAGGLHARAGGRRGERLGIVDAASVGRVDRRSRGARHRGAAHGLSGVGPAALVVLGAEGRDPV